MLTVEKAAFAWKEGSPAIVKDISFTGRRVRYWMLSNVMSYYMCTSQPYLPFKSFLNPDYEVK